MEVTIMTEVVVEDDLPHSYCSICEKSDAEEGVEIITCTSGNLICNVCLELRQGIPPNEELDEDP